MKQISKVECTPTSMHEVTTDSAKDPEPSVDAQDKRLTSVGGICRTRSPWRSSACAHGQDGLKSAGCQIHDHRRRRRGGQPVQAARVAAAKENLTGFITRAIRETMERDSALVGNS